MNPLSLYELNTLVRDAIAQELPDTYWVQGELSEGRVGAGGHFYGELVQRDVRKKKVQSSSQTALFLICHRRPPFLKTHPQTPCRPWRPWIWGRSLLSEARSRAPPRVLRFWELPWSTSCSRRNALLRPRPVWTDWRVRRTWRV